MSDYPLVARRVYLTSMAGMLFKMASLDHAIESAVGFCMVKWMWFATNDITGALAGFSADLDDGHIPARRTTNCVLYK